MTHYGWYQDAKIWKPTRDRAAEVIAKGSNLAIGLIPLGGTSPEIPDCRDRDIPQDVIDNIAIGFEHAFANNMKYIIRFRYDVDGETRDASVDRIMSHIQQLGPLMKAFHESIYTWQAGFVGLWGEWHGSTDAIPEEMEDSEQATLTARIVQALLDNSHERTIISLRTPMLIEDAALSGVDRSRLGIYNDAFCTSETDSGTYSRLPNTGLWKYVAADAPMFGGETYVTKHELYKDQEYVLDEARMMRLVYLNANYSQPIIDYWKANGTYDKLTEIMLSNARAAQVSKEIETPPEVSPASLYGNQHVDALMRWFTYDHLPEGDVRASSELCAILADGMASKLSNGGGAELTAGLRKLLEAKDCFVRATLAAAEAAED